MAKTARGAVRRLRRAAQVLKGERVPGKPVTKTSDPSRERFRQIKKQLQNNSMPPLSGVTAQQRPIVAVAASQRLTHGLSWEWEQVELRPESWRNQLSTSKIDFILIEVHDSYSNAWAPLAELANTQDIPVAVWVTAAAEDPDIANTLTPQATVIFLTADTYIGKWRARWPDARFAVLPPATAPKLHTPANAGPAKDRFLDTALIVDGNEVDSVARAAAEELISLKKLPSSLHVWCIDNERTDPENSYSSVSPINARFTALLPHGITPVDRYCVLADLGRRSSDSYWTLLDAGAAQTAVVTLPDYQETLPEDLQPHVSSAAHPLDFAREITVRLKQGEIRDREALQLHRAVLAKHTFGHRVDQILATFNCSAPQPDNSVSIVVPTNREHEIDNILNNVARQAHTNNELILVLHGISVNHAELRAKAVEKGLERIHILEADSSVKLGSLMNMGIDAADGRYIAKMDDDNYYGRHYLTDLINAFTSTEAGVVGKWSHYVWLRSLNAVVLKFEDSQNCYTRLVQGGSIVVTSEIAREFRFSDIYRAVDSDFLNRIWAAGIKTYSADRFNFVSIRGEDHTQHTWKITDTEMMLGASDVAFFGDPRFHIDI